MAARPSYYYQRYCSQHRGQMTNIELMAEGDIVELTVVAHKTKVQWDGLLKGTCAMN